jgi:hypothetical protein
MTDLSPATLFEPDALARLLVDAPPGGVLSIYVRADNGADPGLRGAAIDIGNRLAELQRNIDAEGPPERARMLAAALRRLAPELGRLTSPQERGRGRALFAPLEDGPPTRVATQLPVANRVVLAPTAFVHPLLELLDEGRPAGVVLASQREARILEWRLGELEELERLQADVVEAPHERSGPVGSSPTARASTPMGEQRAARERVLTLRFLDRVGGTATALAGQRGWERVLISGGERLTEPLGRAMAARLQDVLIRDPRVLIGLDDAELAETITDRLRAVHREEERERIRAVRELALGHGGAALGLSEVVGALNEGRVAHLLYDPEVRYEGAVDADGLLRAGGEQLAGLETTPEPRLTELIVERALRTGARVSPVEGAATDALAEAGGIAAVLRW